MPKYRRAANTYDYFLHLNTGKPCTTCNGSGDQPYNGGRYTVLKTEKCNACKGSGLAQVHKGTAGRRGRK